MRESAGEYDHRVIIGQRTYERQGESVASQRQQPEATATGPSGAMICELWGGFPPRAELRRGAQGQMPRGIPHIPLRRPTRARGKSGEMQAGPCAFQGSHATRGPAEEGLEGAWLVSSASSPAAWQEQLGYLAAGRLTMVTYAIGDRSVCSQPSKPMAPPPMSSAIHAKAL
ncbi:hypothetical protein BO71DRAFT_427904 [Aspergillus ellipticus CBS 707.79]|uniref:Uncharacterized protein n=1 Tax=Aspergillus ellipticus CBS 707.79 TaxID=1448320 RepID=A0A319DYZ2_9EURO|nr:hypothetical protein BO71DRAFT_427904 [Aspergillus ellipticus CBS 707.79]